MGTRLRPEPGSRSLPQRLRQLQTGTEGGGHAPCRVEDGRDRATRSSEGRGEGTQGLYFLTFWGPHPTPREPERERRAGWGEERNEASS